MPKAKFLISVVVAGLVTVGLALTAGVAHSAKTIVKRRPVSTTSNAQIAAAQAGPATLIHYAPNANSGSNGNYAPGKAGFNLADVSNVSQLNSFPAGVKGLVWVGQCNGVDAAFLNTVRPFIGSPKLFGFFLMDDPDPTGKDSAICTADNLKAESDWIHANVPGAQTFIVLMSTSSSKTPSFTGTYNPANSHIDLFGIDPYPCRTELNGCDFEMIDRYVAAAESWGIPRSRLVPVYQAFGGGGWVDDGGGQYALPTARQEQQILTRWGTLIPRPVFDFAYSWGSQKADVALENSSDLKKLFSVHNSATRRRKFLDGAMARSVARNIGRLLTSGGVVVWYDMRYPNPWNPAVRAMTKPRIRELFPSFELELEPLSLLPPIARQLGPLPDRTYGLLASTRILHSRYFGLPRPPSNFLARQIGLQDGGSGDRCKHA